MVKRFLLFILVTLLALQLGFLSFTPEEAVKLVRDYGYLWMLIIHAWFGWSLWRCWREQPREPIALLRRHYGTAIFLLAATVWLHVQERHEFKIVADELVIGNTAMRLHFDRSASIAVRAYDYAGNFTVFNDHVDKRPLAFPFLLATVHDLTGYRPSNVFGLNALISFCLVVVVWRVAARLGGGSKAGVAAVVLLCGTPLIAQNATGGGFELHNFFMIVLTLWLGMRYAEKPGGERLAAFILSGVILAQVRYESAFFVLPVGVAVLWVWWREYRPNFSLVVILAPLLMLPVPLQQNVFKLAESTWQLNDVDGATSPFGFGYFYLNVGHALNFFLSFDGQHPNSWLLAILGGLGVGFALLRLYRERSIMANHSPRDVVASIFLIGLLCHAVLMLCYFWGKWDDPIIRRLSLPTHALFLVAIAFVWGRLVRNERAWEALIVAAGVHLALFASPASARHVFTQENFAAATCNWVAKFIRESVPGSALAIDDNAGSVWFLYRKACISSGRLTFTWEGFIHHFERRSFSDYIVVQRVGVDQSTGEKFVSKKDDFGDGLRLELLEERAFAPFYFVRISRVVGVDREKLRVWAEDRVKTRQMAVANGLNERQMWVAEPVNQGLLEHWFRALP